MSTIEVRNEKNDALATAAVVALASALAYGLKKALADSGTPLRSARDSVLDGTAADERSRDRSLLPMALESTPVMLLPVLDNAADAAGKWVAENSPDLIRHRLLPRFIGAFTDAAKGR